VGAALIRDATPDDFPAILALNAESVHRLSPLDTARLRHLHAQAACHRVIEVHGRLAAFLLALREGADYASPNYRWFAARYRVFVYIDRVVVDAASRGLGLGLQLYDDVIAFAARAGVARLVCEFDVDPPNPASANFHRRCGFREVGTHRVDDARKQVSLQLRDIESAKADSGMIGD